MSFIILVIILLIWGWIVFIINPVIVRDISPPIVKVILTPIIFLMLFIAPVADDIIGGFQFRHICEENSQIYINENARGKTVKLQTTSGYENNTIVPIEVFTRDFKDIENNETVVRYKVFRAYGGWLSRLEVFMQGSPPFTFNKTCVPKEFKTILHQLDITKVQ